MSNRLPSALFDLDEYIFFLILDNICRLCYQESTDMCLCVYSSYYYRFVAAVTGSWSHYLFTHSSEADIVKQLTYFQTTLLVIFHNGHHTVFLLQSKICIYAKRIDFQYFVHSTTHYCGDIWIVIQSTISVHFDMD